MKRPERPERPQGQTGHQIAMSLRAGYLTMHRQTQSQLAKLGVTADQFVVLSVLAERDGLTQQELVRRASSDPNTMRSMLILLERGGLVRREAHPNDGRARCVTLTDAGRKMHERVSTLLKPLQDRLLSLFVSSEAELLVDLLARVTRM